MIGTHSPLVRAAGASWTRVSGGEAGCADGTKSSPASEPITSGADGVGVVKKKTVDVLISPASLIRPYAHFVSP